MRQLYSGAQWFDIPDQKLLRSADLRARPVVPAACRAQRRVREPCLVCRSQGVLGAEF